MKTQKRRFSQSKLLTASLLIFLGSPQANLPLIGTKIDPVFAQSTSDSLSKLMQEGTEYFNQSKFAEAAQAWQQAAASFTNSGNQLQAARAWSFSSVAWQQLGEWQQARTAINTSLSLLQTVADSEGRSLVLAQTLNAQGNWQLATGKTAEALKTWQQAQEIYTSLKDERGLIGILINQADAFQRLGQNPRAFENLVQVSIRLEKQPDSLQKINAWRRLGELVRVVGIPKEANSNWQELAKSFKITEEDEGSLKISQKILRQSLNLAVMLRENQAIAAANISLAKLKRDEFRRDRNAYKKNVFSNNNELPEFYKAATEALEFYGAAIANSPAKNISIPAALNQMNLQLEMTKWLLERQEWTAASSWWHQQTLSVKDLLKLQAEVAQLPASLTTIKTQVSLTQNLVYLKKIQKILAANNSSVPEIAKSDLWSNLDSMISQNIAAMEKSQTVAENLGDRHSLAEIKGNIGKLYELVNNLPPAEQFTNQAIQISQSVQAWDILYQWQWQLGRIREAKGQILGESGAIAAYKVAVDTLKNLRQDIAALNPELQFTFQDEIEPVYRQYANLLMRSPQSEDLAEARQTLASLQLAELENFLQSACADANSAQLDEVIDKKAKNTAVVYTIVLEDRLEIVLKLPNKKKLQSFKIPVTKLQIETTVAAVKEKLFQGKNRTDRSIQEMKSATKPIYNWIINPIKSQLQANGIKTLVFVLDRALQNIPLGVISDGEKYLVEDYAIGLHREPQIIDPKPLSSYPIEILAMGLSKQRDLPTHKKFRALEEVVTELTDINPNVKLLDEDFTSSAFQNKINSSPFSIVHLATHGQFSSDPNQTFILAWDKQIKFNELSNLLKSRGSNLPDTIELLVLSACETAEGDSRATLGLAGISVRAGARSTLATLWQVKDSSTRIFMKELYQVLNNKAINISKAEAIQRIQKDFIASNTRKHPYNWAAFVLVGNWL